MEMFKSSQQMYARVSPYLCSTKKHVFTVVMIGPLIIDRCANRRCWHPQVVQNLVGAFVGSLSDDSMLFQK